jgi:hypothetical protein
MLALREKVRNWRTTRAERKVTKMSEEHASQEPLNHLALQVPTAAGRCFLVARVRLDRK